MNISSETIKWSKLLARIYGSICLVFLLFMFGAHIIEDISGMAAVLTNFQNPVELLSFVTFPLLTIVGLSLAYKSEITGAIVILGAALLLMLMRSDLLLNPYMLAIFSSGIWYLITALLMLFSNKKIALN